MGSWHLVRSYFEEPDDPDSSEILRDVMHPGCGISFSSQAGIRYECDLTLELDNCGWDTIFPDADQRTIGWHWVRIEHVTLRGFDWTEYDIDFYVEPATVPPDVERDAAAAFEAEVKRQARG